MMDFETSKKEIEKLVEEFKENEHYYKSPSFDEENTKVNFINKFFIALGWDVYNDLGIAPQYKDVEFEDTIIIGGKPKAPDYCFRIGGARKFFVEAKKPSVDIEKDRTYAHQLKRYTWSAKLPIGLLTDFEELAIYEPKSAPKKTHNSSIDRIKYYKYDEYIEKWEEIYNIFSKEAVLTGKFDKFVDDIGGSSGKKGTSTVDSEFLKTIEEWRLELARNMAIRNENLTVEELNFAVQLIIDRIIFLRIAEDRGIEHYGQLKKLLELAKNEKDNYPVYEAFIELCKKADAKYNSGLFHFKEEKEISLSADTLTPTLKIDDGKLVEIIKELYYPDCPYEFSLISTEILGNIYEQFLGKVIRLTDGHQAKVEDKPEVKKAGGVYYTPQYIVEYIVENTIGELLKGKTPNQVSKLKFVDPACGSGSFLLGAYQKLIDWHIEYYSNLEKPPKDVIYTGKDGIPRLTIQEKKRILLKNIYGVDIDSQAVEVTKLSLLLKVLEDTNKDVLEAQQKLIQERALPYLGDNIRCGNSLIGTNILDSNDLTSEEIQEINPFDWKDEFKEIFENGGFDAVIGNPPYVRIQNLDGILKDSYASFYKNIISGNYDLYILFIKKGYDLTKKEGRLGYILPNKFFTTNYGFKIREYISEKQCINKIIDFKTNQIFENATTYTCLLFLSNKKIKEFNYSSIELGNDTHDLKNLNYDKIKINTLNPDSWIFTNEKTNLILNKIKKQPWDFTNISEKIFKGSSTGNDNIFLFEYISEDSEYYYVNSKVKEDIKLEKDLIKPFINGRDVRKYETPSINKLLLFPYQKNGTKMELILLNDLKEKYPFIYEYLTEFRDLLKKRKIKMDNKNFYKYSAPRNLNEYEKNKIMIPDMLIQSKMTIDSSRKIFHGPAIHSIAFKEELDTNVQLGILGILNSKLFWFFISHTSTALKGNAYRLTPKYLNNFNFPDLNINKTKLTQIKNTVEKILKLNKELASCKTPKEEKLLKIQIEKTDGKIDQLVYELYDLTEEEISIIEESLK